MLPAYGLTGTDVDAVKFTQVLRGYKTSEVDWVLDRLARELEALRGQLAAVHASSVVENEAEAGRPDVPKIEDGADVGDHQDPT